MADYTPIEVPVVTENTVQNVELTEEQEQKYNDVLAHFSKDDFKVPGEEKGDLMDEEKFWLSKECILRYLRASNWVVHTSIHRMEETLKWRREFGFYNDTMTAGHVEPESVTGKEIVFGYDVERRPTLYMIPSRQNSTESPRQLHFAVWMLERSIDLMGPGVESLDLLINFADRAKNPSIGTTRAMLHILQSHYPERLGLALIINVPFLIHAFFRIIMPFVDPVTRKKVKFNPQIFDEGYMTPDQVMKEGWDGARDFQWDHSRYWPALVRMCDERRAAQMTHWRELGAKVGISEWEVRTRAQQEHAQPPCLEVTDEKRSEPAESETVEVTAVVEV